MGVAGAPPPPRADRACVYHNTRSSQQHTVTVVAPFEVCVYLGTATHVAATAHQLTRKLKAVHSRVGWGSW